MPSLKRFFYKSTVALHIVMICCVYWGRITLSICEINLYVNHSLLSFGYIMLSIIWLCCSPFKKSCCNGHWTELLFYMAPMEVFFMFVFAQWHFTITISLLILFLIVEAVLMWTLNMKFQHLCKEKRRRRYRRIFPRCTVLVMALLFAVPCFLASFVYGLQEPEYTEEERLWQTILEEEDSLSGEAEEDIYEKNRALLECFRYQQWEEYNVREKVTIMQKLVDLETEILQIPKIPVTAKRLGEFVLGEYDGKTNEMWIDIEHLAKEAVGACMETICHEVYHSYQRYLVENVDWEDEVLQNPYFEELRAWKQNQEGYIDPDINGYDAYQSQPLEFTARAFARDEVERIYSYIE